MEKLQIVFVITLRLQITQTFIIVIGIKLFQPEKLTSRQESQTNDTTNVQEFAHVGLAAALLLITWRGGICKAAPENQSSPLSCILCFEPEPSVAWLFPRYLPPLVSSLVPS